MGDHAKPQRNEAAKESIRSTKSHERAPNNTNKDGAFFVCLRAASCKFVDRNPSSAARHRLGKALQNRRARLELYGLVAGDGVCSEAGTREGSGLSGDVCK